MYEQPELVAHWLNCRWGWGRRVVKLFRNPQVPIDHAGAWTLRIEVGRHEGDFPYRTEQRVREDIEILLADPDRGPFSLVGGTDHDRPAVMDIHPQD
jgi:hypothetical protein